MSEIDKNVDDILLPLDLQFDIYQQTKAQLYKLISEAIEKAGLLGHDKGMMIEEIDKLFNLKEEQE